MICNANDKEYLFLYPVIVQCSIAPENLINGHISDRKLMKKVHDVNTKSKSFAKSVLWDDGSPILLNISRPESVYANAVDVCVWIEKNLSIFKTFNRLKRKVFEVFEVFEESEYFRDV